MNGQFNGGLEGELNRGLNSGLNRGLHSDAGLGHSVTTSRDGANPRASVDSVYHIGLYIPPKQHTNCS